MYQPRTYRALAAAERFAYFPVRYRETDLWIGVDRPSLRSSLGQDVLERVIDLRLRLESYIERRPEFRSSFEPIPDDPGAPAIASAMLRAAREAGVGPMAAVAGAFADAAARFLLGPGRCREVVVENGGDIALSGESEFTAALLAGTSSLSGALGLRIRGGGYRGLAASAGRVGPSYSAGRADACAVLARDAARADALATAFGNRVGSGADIEGALDLARRTEGVLGIALIAGSTFGCAGDLELVPLAAGRGRAGKSPKSGPDSETRRRSDPAEPETRTVRAGRLP